MNILKAIALYTFVLHCVVHALCLTKAVLKGDGLAYYNAKSLKWITDTLQL